MIVSKSSVARNKSDKVHDIKGIRWKFNRLNKKDYIIDVKGYYTLGVIF